MDKKEEEKNFRIIPTILRFFLSMFIIYQIYGETGPFTALFSFLVYISMEVQSALITIQFKVLKDFMEGVLSKFEWYEKIFKPKSTKEMVDDEIIRRTKEN